MKQSKTKKVVLFLMISLGCLMPTVTHCFSPEMAEKVGYTCFWEVLAAASFVGTMGSLATTVVSAGATALGMGGMAMAQEIQDEGKKSGNAAHEGMGAAGTLMGFIVGASGAIGTVGGLVGTGVCGTVCGVSIYKVIQNCKD